MTQQEDDRLEFTLFPKLPAELQLKIWKSTTPPPQTIKISATVDDNKKVKLSAEVRPSSLLGTCKTSHDTLMETHYSSIKMDGDGSQRLFFDNDADIIFLSSGGQLLTNELCVLECRKAESFADVKTLAISISGVRSITRQGLSRESLLSHLHSLQTVLVVGPHYSDALYKRSPGSTAPYCFQDFEVSKASTLKTVEGYLAAKKASEEALLICARGVKRLVPEGRKLDIQLVANTGTCWRDE